MTQEQLYRIAIHRLAVLALANMQKKAAEAQLKAQTTAQPEN